MHIHTSLTKMERFLDATKINPKINRELLVETNVHKIILIEILIGRIFPG